MLISRFLLLKFDVVDVHKRETRGSRMNFITAYLNTNHPICVAYESDQCLSHYIMLNDYPKS